MKGKYIIHKIKKKKREKKSDIPENKEFMFDGNDSSLNNSWALQFSFISMQKMHGTQSSEGQ